MLKRYTFEYAAYPDQEPVARITVVLHAAARVFKARQLVEEHLENNCREKLKGLFVLTKAEHIGAVVDSNVTDTTKAD